VASAHASNGLTHAVLRPVAEDPLGRGNERIEQPFEAAANSPSLTVCDGGGEVVVASPDDPDGGVDVGDGVISVS
jgi:hypothetical protein